MGLSVSYGGKIPNLANIFTPIHNSCFIPSRLNLHRVTHSSGEIRDFTTLSSKYIFFLVASLGIWTLKLIWWTSCLCQGTENSTISCHLPQPINFHSTYPFFWSQGGSIVQDVFINYEFQTAKSSKTHIITPCYKFTNSRWRKSDF